MRRENVLQDFAYYSIVAAAVFATAYIKDFYDHHYAAKEKSSSSVMATLDKGLEKQVSE